MVTKLGFAGYYLIVADFVAWARANGVPVGPGRGSGAGSPRGLGPRHYRHRPDCL